MARSFKVPIAVQLLARVDCGYLQLDQNSDQPPVASPCAAMAGYSREVIANRKHSWRRTDQGIEQR
jgi:hypothetical protein